MRIRIISYNQEGNSVANYTEKTIYCDYCRGTGEVDEKTCPYCEGDGVTTVRY